MCQTRQQLSHCIFITYSCFCSRNYGLNFIVNALHYETLSEFHTHILSESINHKICVKFMKLLANYRKRCINRKVFAELIYNIKPSVKQVDAKLLHQLQMRNTFQNASLGNLKSEIVL